MTTAVSEQVREEHVSEHVASNAGAALNVDRENHVVRHVKIIGNESRNGRTYPQSVLSKSRHLYEGVPVNLNHPRGRPTDPRGYEERLGHFRNVREGRDGGLYGDFHYNPKHAVAEQFLWDCEHAPQNCGFSHNAAIKTRTANGRVIVEAITAVASVDLVADPATTNSVFEHTEAQPEGSTVTVTVESLKKDHPNVYEAVVREAIEAHKAGDEAKALEAKCARLEAELATIKAKQEAEARKAAVEAKIAEANLPEALVTESFKKLCHAAEDDAALETIISDWKKIADEAKLPVKKSTVKAKDQQATEGAGSDAPITDGASFAKLLKG